MLFSSITFLYLFLPVVLIAYYLLPRRMKNGVLLIASLLFYFFGEPVYVLILVVSSVSDFCHSLFIEKHRGKKSAKIALISSIVINLGLLCVFKYADFLIGAFNGITGMDVPLLGLPLPLGISFFTFQTMSYTIDVYRGRVRADRNLATFATFVCLFPQLVAGPIVRYTDISERLHERRVDIDDIANGIRRFVFGLGKKVLIANAMGEFCAIFRDSGEQSVVFYWLYAIAFTMQIYFDFSGYSDMAIGLGKMFGFEFPENFNYPYISKSITEFWRRWHMTLGGWFKDYLYIPLGGNRNGIVKNLRNIAIVWLLTGLWHGAQWNFVLWGGMYGVLLIIEKLFLAKALDKTPRIVNYVYVMLLTIIGFVIFNADGIGQAWSDIRAMFGFGGVPFMTAETMYYLRSFLALFVVAFVASTPAVKLICERVKKAKAIVVLQPAAIALVLVCVTAYLVDGSFNPFLYFRF